jgi:HK97 family phage portal protein
MFIRNALERRDTPVVGLNDPTLLEWLGIDPETVQVGGKNALKEATVYACIKILSDAVAKLPLKVYRETGQGVIKATNHPLYRLLKARPNPYMTSSTFFRAVEAQRNLYGNAYVMPEIAKRGRNAGQVLGLYPVDGSRVEVWIDDVGLFSSKNHIWYVVDVGNGEKIKLTNDEILHLKGLTTDGLVGIAPLDALKYLIENGMSATTFINNFYRQGLQTKGIVQYVGDLNQDAKNKFREKFEEMSSGLKNAHRISLMPVGFQYQPISLSMADAQFLENTTLTIRQIANAFGVKMHQLNDLEKATHTNIEQQQRQFYADTLQAILTEYEQEITYKLLLTHEIESGHYCKFNVDSIVRSDIKTRYEAYRIGVQGGFLTANEVRSLEEYPPADGGDVLLVNGSQIPASMAGQQYTPDKGGEDDGEE